MSAEMQAGDARPYNVLDADFMEDRVYYTDLPRHVLLVIDGDRRYAKNVGRSEAAVYDDSQRQCGEFFRLGLQDLGLDQLSMFILRPESFSSQNRTEENLTGIFDAVTKLANGLRTGDYGIDLRKSRFETVTLAGRPWMEPPTRVRRSTTLLQQWEVMADALCQLQTIGKDQPKVGRLMINYSGRAEYEALMAGKMMRESAFPDVGLIIRTGDGMRLSDGPAHATFDAHFDLIPKYFPAVTEDDITTSVRQYLMRGR